jgi:hypothetical protein
MWKVKYYMVGGTLTTKYFPNLFEATQFAVYKAPFQSVYSMDKI